MLLNKLRDFFWVCSGANIGLLEKCKTEASKYAGIGATVFFTGVFAALAAGYALYSVFDNIWSAAITGLLWGLMIFNLDRYIVSSMRKENNFKRELALASPRILLAIIISIVIAKPLELKIFEKEIQPELSIMEQEVYARQEKKLKQRFLPYQDSVKREIETLKKEIDSKAKYRDELLSVAQQEADGTGGSKRRNLGPIYKLKKLDAEKADQEFQNFQLKNSGEIDRANKLLVTNDSLMKAALFNLVRGKLDGPAAKLEALSRLTKESNAMALANIFIMLLFIAIETAPVFVKLISKEGPYDELLKSEEHFFKVQSLESRIVINIDTKKRMEGAPTFEHNLITNRLDNTLEKS